MNYKHLLDQYPNKDVRGIDISIGAKEYWGKGIGTKVVKLMTKFGFDFNPEATKLYWVVIILKHKRLSRDRESWRFGGFPYYQMRVEIEEFHGLVSLIQLGGDGRYYYWDLPISGQVAVCGKGMTWLQLIPDGKKHILTAKYLPENKTVQGVEYKDSVSVWYADVIEDIEYDTDGVAVFIDKYIDVIFTPQGDMIVDDRDELDAALQSGDISKEQYDSALNECDLIIEKYCADIMKTEAVCYKILSHVYEKIKSGEKQFIPTE